MNSKSSSNKFFLFSFFPAIAYWYLESKYPLKIAVAGGLVLALIEISAEKIFFKHVHTLSKFNFFLLLFLGGLSLLGDDGIWFKLQPFFTGLVFGGVLIFYLKKGKGLMAEMMESMGKADLPEPIFRSLEWHVAILMISYGIFMAGIAFFTPTSTWVFFKTAGFYLVFAVFMLVEVFYMRKQMKTYYENQMKKDTMRRF
jgi:intracellular septation protein